MNQDEIFRMAREAGVTKPADPDAWDIFQFGYESLERFAAFVAAHEREECAKFCDDQYEFYGFDHVFAAGIRARGEK
jgi:hypothetical protein